MYASNLEETLYVLMQKSDVAQPDLSEFRARMESLRNFGRLPRGHENHAALLTDEQIADAILGLAAVKPNWAGPAASALRTLKPVGGPAASFEKADTLSKAVQILLANKQARDRLIELTLSTAEHGTNATGHATLRYKGEEGERTVYFVHQLAVSLHGAGAEKRYNPDVFITPSGGRLALRGTFSIPLPSGQKSHVT